MSLYRHFSAGLAVLFRRREADRALDDELRQFVDAATADYERRGMSRDDAARQAKIDIGGMSVAKDNVRDAGWESTVDSTWRDLRISARSLRRSPAFAASAIITLALGIGVNTAMFSIVESVVLRPLPYAAPERLATLWTDDPKHGDKEEGTSNLNFLDWRSQTRSFKDLAVCSRGNAVILGGEAPERIDAEAISANMLPLLGARPMLGRNFTDDEERRGEVTAILSYGLWQRRFGGEASIVGRTIELDGRPIRVVGAMPRDFFFPTERTQLWLTANPSDTDRRQRTSDTWRVVGRLVDGATFVQAGAEMRAIGARLEAAYPQTDPGFAGYGVNVVPMLEQVIGTSLPRALWLLLGAVACVLGIACANVANLLLARAASRQRDLAIRSSLGASRSRLVAHALVEAGLLGFSGAVLGIALGSALVQVARTAYADAIPRIAGARIDVRVLSFAGAIALAATIAFALVPVFQISRDELRHRAASRASSRARRALVISECALAVVLLVGASLLVRSLVNVDMVDAGFEPERSLLVRIAFPEGPAAKQAHDNRRGDLRLLALIDRVRALPGVQSAGAMRDFVLARNTDWVATVDATDGPRETNGPLTAEYVTPGVFAALGATIVQGREFRDEDFGGARAVIVNTAFARRYFGRTNVLGLRVREGGLGSHDGWMTVVGVVKDIRRAGLEVATVPQFYMPWLPRETDIIVRTAGQPSRIVTDVRAAIREISPSAAIERITPLRAVYGRTSAARRAQTTLLLGFAVLALLMSAVGIYGVLHYLVATRTREIGVRMALGARSLQAMHVVVGEALTLAGVGVVAGVIVAVGVAGLMRHMLFGIGPRDPLSIVAAGVALLVVAGVASAHPARRASRIDPMIALRGE